MTAGASEGDPQALGIGHGDPGMDRDQASRQRSGHVPADSGIDREPVEQPGVEHGLRPSQLFLGGLEHEQVPAGEVFGP